MRLLLKQVRIDVGRRNGHCGITAAYVRLLVDRVLVHGLVGGVRLLRRHGVITMHLLRKTSGRMLVQRLNVEVRVELDFWGGGTRLCGRRPMGNVPLEVDVVLRVTVG